MRRPGEEGEPISGITIRIILKSTVCQRLREILEDEPSPSPGGVLLGGRLAPGVYVIDSAGTGEGTGGSSPSGFFAFLTHSIKSLVSRGRPRKIGIWQAYGDGRLYPGSDRFRCAARLQRGALGASAVKVLLVPALRRNRLRIKGFVLQPRTRSLDEVRIEGVLGDGTVVDLSV
ncbi:MAG: hypothetical protein GF333_03590 [Candidatus Omnitrophica bacterium]|nr:hypothetical protein [Candidatus Omnitrophota bacterium]